MDRGRGRNPDNQPGLLVWEGYHESRRCSRDTYPESHITKYTSIQVLHTWILLAIVKQCLVQMGRKDGQDLKAVEGRGDGRGRARARPLFHVRLAPLQRDKRLPFSVLKSSIFSTKGFTFQRRGIMESQRPHPVPSPCILPPIRLLTFLNLTASKRRGDGLKGFKDIYLQATANIWP